MIDIDKSKPFLIQLKAIGDSTEGYLTVAEEWLDVPFDIKRVYWSYYTPQMITRGRHAHYKLEQVLVAVSGKIVVTNESLKGETFVHVLDEPNVGLYVPPMYWHVIQFSHNAVMMSLASTPYDENDYITSYEDFLKIEAKKK
ncbi:MAG TPA: FdtA/QdtA family cupin domain-containing protein [Cytophagaceae bacterium]|nr:FdtA/QdtA family cupin domain-containing protein [Cytophagaceae bacterium]